MTVKAKFRCISYQDTTFSKTSTQRKVFFMAVYGNSEENQSFSKATPQGNLDMVIDSGTEAYNTFFPGKEYYLTFEEAI